MLCLQVWRQRNPEFVRMLNNIRSGNGKAAIQELLQQCSRPLPEQNGVKPTQLFSRNADVDTVNAEELRALQGEEVCFLYYLGIFHCFQYIHVWSPCSIGTLQACSAGM